MTGISFFCGINVMRLLTSNFFGRKSFTADLNKWKFFYLPLNKVANMSAIFNGVQLIICMISLILFSISNDVFMLGLYGFFLNLTMLTL